MCIRDSQAESNGFGGSSYSYGQTQPQQTGLPYGAGMFGGSGGRFPRSPAGSALQGESNGFGGSSYSNGQTQPVSYTHLDVYKRQILYIFPDT